MNFEVSKLNDYPASSPFVARTIIQFSDILEVFIVDKDTKESIKELCFEILNHLGVCFDIADRVSQQIKSGNEVIKELDQNTEMQATMVQLPSVINLKKELDAYLNSAKMSLRDTGKLFKILFGKEFNHHFHKLKEHILKEGDKFSKVLSVIEHYQPIIEQIIDFRNVTEHPSQDRKLIIDDFSSFKENGIRRFREPTWSINAEIITSIEEDISKITQCLLYFFEDFLSSLILAYSGETKYEIAEIPEENRDKDCPVRLRTIPKIRPE